MRLNLSVVREQDYSIADKALRVSSHPVVTKQIATICRHGKDSSDTSETSGKVGIIAWFQVNKHRDALGIVYLLPLIAARSSLYVGSKRMRLKVGEIIAFNDHLNHWTCDESPCASLIYCRDVECEDEQIVVNKLDDCLDKLYSEVQ